MARIGIVSDIHGNLEAFNKALEYFRENQIDKIFCLGDIVGYGPNPEECVNLVRDHCNFALMGNHDYAAIGLANIDFFNEYAKLATYWTQEKLSDKNKEYLKTLPFTHEENQLMFVHASPKSPSSWDYVLSVDDANRQFNHFDSKICFIGHSHVPIIFSESNYFRKKEFLFSNNEKYIVNIGSLGQPRDGDPRSCFVVYDEDENKIEYIRLDYDIQKTYNKITNAGLPLFLAERLLKGY